MDFKVLVITDTPEYWFDYFRHVLDDYCVVTHEDVKARTGFFFCKDSSELQ